MSQSNRTAVNDSLDSHIVMGGLDIPVYVDFLRIDAQDLLSSPNDNGECFVDFKECDILDRKVCCLKGLGQCNRGCKWKVNGVQAGVSVSLSRARTS